MNIIYTGQDLSPAGSVFLAGPTPRSPEVESWRPDFIAALKDGGYEGLVFNPEFEDQRMSMPYDNKIEWEHTAIEVCDLILFWVPREIEMMPAFTTNVEFGLWIKSGKMLYGRPEWAAKKSYLDWCYKKFTGREPFSDMETYAKEVKKITFYGKKNASGTRS